MKKQTKFGVGISVIVIALGFLAWLGYGESKTYYHTIAELQTLTGSARSQRMRVGGTVAAGSIHRCRILLWINRKRLWKAAPLRTADLWLSTFRRNAPPSTKRCLQAAPRPAPAPKAACSRPGFTGGEAGSRWMYSVPLPLF